MYQRVHIITYITYIYIYILFLFEHWHFLGRSIRVVAWVQVAKEGDERLLSQLLQRRRAKLTSDIDAQDGKAGHAGRGASPAAGIADRRSLGGLASWSLKLPFPNLWGKLECIDWVGSLDFNFLGSQWVSQ